VQPADALPAAGAVHTTHQDGRNGSGDRLSARRTDRLGFLSGRRTDRKSERRTERLSAIAERASFLLLRGLTSRLRQDPQREACRWLLYLTPEMWCAGERCDQLTAEVTAALRARFQPLLLYSPEACTFDELIGATPRELLAEGLYRPVAIEWRSGALRAVSERLVAKSLGARMGQTCGEWMIRQASRCAAGAASAWRSTEQARARVGHRSTDESRLASRRSGRSELSESDTSAAVSIELAEACGSDASARVSGCATRVVSVSSVGEGRSRGPSQA